MIYLYAPRLHLIPHGTPGREALASTSRNPVSGGSIAYGLMRGRGWDKGLFRFYITFSAISSIVAMSFSSPPTPRITLSAPASAYRSMDSGSAGTPMTDISISFGSRPLSSASRSSSERPWTTSSVVMSSGSQPSPHLAILLKTLGALLPSIIGGYGVAAGLGKL